MRNFGRKKHNFPEVSSGMTQEKIPDRDKDFRLFVSLILLGFGIYLSVLYFGYQKVPAPDFLGYVTTGRQLLSLNLPTTFTRAPVLGIVIVGLSHFTGGSCPELMAGWLLGSILHPLNLLLLWLVGRQVVGNSAFWIALVAILNPWVMRLLMDPIVETTLLFCILITFYCIFRRSRFSYLFASITSLVRYEGVVLILTAFIIDMITRKTRKERGLTLLYAFLSAMPLLTWLLGSLLLQRGIYYLKSFNQNQDPLSLKIYQIWEVTFSSWLKTLPSSAVNLLVFTAAKIVAAAGIISGVVYGLYRRRWEILALLIFFTGYLFIHLFYLTLWRYWIPVLWILLFIWWYGWQNLWGLINRNILVSKVLKITGMGLILAVAVFCFISSLAGLPGITSGSEKSVSLPYVTIGVVIILFAGRLFYSRKKQWCRDLTASILVCSLLVTNQYALVKQIGSGQQNIEFKYLAEWYIKNAGHNAKIVCTMPPLLTIFAPKYENNFVPIVDIKANNPREFIRECRRRGITYITWDSRMCSDVKWRFYEYWGIDNIRILSRPRSAEPYEFVTRIVNDSDPDKFVNVFRLTH